MVLTSPSSSGPSIQAHLYDAFLNRETCDVSLVCVGRQSARQSGTSATPQQWKASYESHRVILIQAGYFKSLFTSGFAESQNQSSGANGPTVGRPRAYSYGELDVRLRFDDPNITRAGMCLYTLSKLSSDTL